MSLAHNQSDTPCSHKVGSWPALLRHRPALSSKSGWSGGSYLPRSNKVAPGRAPRRPLLRSDNFRGVERGGTRDLASCKSVARPEYDFFFQKNHWCPPRPSRTQLHAWYCVTFSQMYPTTGCTMKNLTSKSAPLGRAHFENKSAAPFFRGLREEIFWMTQRQKPAKIGKEVFVLLFMSWHYVVFLSFVGISQYVCLCSSSSFVVFADVSVHFSKGFSRSERERDRERERGYRAFFFLLRWSLLNPGSSFVTIQKKIVDSAWAVWSEAAKTGFTKAYQETGGPPNFQSNPVTCVG